MFIRIPLIAILQIARMESFYGETKVCIPLIYQLKDSSHSPRAEGFVSSRLLLLLHLALCDDK